MTVLIRSSLLVLAMGVGFTGPLAIDLNGHPVTALAPAGARAVVLFFAASDCPISNRYIPEVQRLARQFEPLGVRVWFVYPNPGDDAKVIRAHDLEFAITASTALDTRQTLTRMAQVTITPEAAMFVPRGTSLHEVYRGRIDDRYIALGTERPQATHHDLEEAIAAVLADKPVPQPAGPPIGCSIVTQQP
jgi:AhpC/TSA family